MEESRVKEQREGFRRNRNAEPARLICFSRRGDSNLKYLLSKFMSPEFTAQTPLCFPPSPRSRFLCNTTKTSTFSPLNHITLFASLSLVFFYFLFKDMLLRN